MDSPQFKNTSVFAEPEKQSAGLFHKMPEQRKDITVYNAEDSIGVIDVFVHKARDIHNICIYHKQDVYAKLCLTSNPENAVSTKTINGGGQNPVFNDNVRLNVHAIDASLKCEIWMLSRVKNYLEDQLLGFALVPLSEILVGRNGKLEKEFSLSSTDLFHSPAGFVQLSLVYNGVLPEVVASSSVPAASINVADKEEKTSDCFSSELDKIEFPDPKIETENHLMVSECFGIPCADLISQGSDVLSSDAENQLNLDAGVKFMECFSAETGSSPIQVTEHDHSSPSNESSAYRSPKASNFSKDDDDDHGSVSEESLKGKNPDVIESDTKSNNTSESESDGSYIKPVINVKLEQPEQQVVQQDIVDMYMKSMQQFTESLAKMKLPLDIDNKPPACSGDSSSDIKLQASKESGKRVFYGSRAFF